MDIGRMEVVEGRVEEEKGKEEVREEGKLEMDMGRWRRVGLK